MAKKEIVILALTAALLMTTHAVPASAAENAPDGVPQTTSTRVITPRWESTNTVVPLISISGKKISVSVVIEPKNRRSHLWARSIWKRKPEAVGRQLLLGRLMRPGRSALPKLTLVRQALHTEPVWLSRLDQIRLTQPLLSVPSKTFEKIVPFSVFIRYIGESKNQEVK